MQGGGNIGQHHHVYGSLPIGRILLLHFPFWRRIALLIGRRLKAEERYIFSTSNSLFHYPNHERNVQLREMRDAHSAYENYLRSLHAVARAIICQATGHIFFSFF